jgi:uncharacterized protein (TIGR01741 family)
MEQLLDQYYRQIVNQLSVIIPEKWENLILYSEVSDELSKIHFYYYSMSSNQYISGGNIFELFPIDEFDFRDSWRNIVTLFEHMQTVFVAHNQEPWTNLTMRLDHSGKFNIEFHYDDFTEIDAYARLMLWKHMVAQVHLQDSFEISSANDYIKYLLKNNLKYNNLPVELIKV